MESRDIQIKAQGAKVSLCFSLLLFVGHMSYHTKAIQCDAAAMVSNSPIRTLNFTKMGQFLSVGFENGQV